MNTPWYIQFIITLIDLVIFILDLQYIINHAYDWIINNSPLAKLKLHKTNSKNEKNNYNITNDVLGIHGSQIYNNFVQRSYKYKATIYIFLSSSVSVLTTFIPKCELNIFIIWFSLISWEIFTIIKLSK